MTLQSKQLEDVKVGPKMQKLFRGFRLIKAEPIVSDPFDESTDMTAYVVGDWYRETRYLLYDFPRSGKAQNARILQLHKCLLSLPEAEEDLKRWKGVAA